MSEVHFEQNFEISRNKFHIGKWKIDLKHFPTVVLRSSFTFHLCMEALKLHFIFNDAPDYNFSEFLTLLHGNCIIFSLFIFLLLGSFKY